MLNFIHYSCIMTPGINAADALLGLRLFSGEKCSNPFHVKSEKEIKQRKIVK